MLAVKIALVALALAAAAPTNPDAIVPDSEFVETAIPPPGEKFIDGLFNDFIGGTAPQNFCSDWCNTDGIWGCGMSTLVGTDKRNRANTDYTCDCAGCNGCAPPPGEKCVDGLFDQRYVFDDGEDFCSDWCNHDGIWGLRNEHFGCC